MTKKTQPTQPHEDDDADVKKHIAMCYTSPQLAAARIIGATEKTAKVAMQELLERVSEICTKVTDGDMRPAEKMMMSQAVALQEMFVHLTDKALLQAHMPYVEAYMRLALRAQAQCRTTLETLANIKNPPVVFARQANVTTGPQQINNGTAPPSRTGENKNEPNQLLDAGTQGTAGGFDTGLEALGEINRPEVCRR